jgi:hypothetical protein
MNNLPISQTEKPKSPPWKKIAIGGCSVIVLCLLLGFGIYAFALWGGGGEPATLIVAERVDQEFLQAIHNRQIDTAYAMLSEKFTPKISKEQLAELIQQDEKIFSSYKKFDVCDWEFYISNGRVITSSGLLYYEGGVIVVETALHKDSDSVWRVQGFQFRSDIAPKPFGFCK